MEYLSLLLHQLVSAFNLYSILALLLPLFVSFMWLITWRSFKNSTLKHPPGPWTVPIIGNLLQLDTGCFHRSLHLLSRKHGALMLLKLGSFRVCVVSSAKLAEEVMKDLDLTFADRPELASSFLLSYGGADIAFQSYGETWRHLKKMAILQLLSSKKVLSFKSVREEEVGLLLQAISSASGPVNLSELMFSLASNINCRAALGKKYNHGEGGYGKSRFQDTLATFQALLAAFCAGDFFPYFKCVDWLTGLHRKLLPNFHDLDRFYDEVIRDHSDPQRRPEQHNLVRSLLDEQKNGSHGIFLSGDTIKGMLMVCLLYASLPSSSIVSFIWNVLFIAI